MTILKVRLTFEEDILGMSPNSKQVYTDYIADKSPDAATIEEEVAAVGVDQVTENAMTVFPRENGAPFMYDYQVKGFFKDACGMLARVTGKDENGKKKTAANESSKLKAFKKVIDGLIFVYPRKILFNFDGEIGNLQRPLRAQTAQGERIALANSETISAKATLEFEIKCLSDELVAVVKEWLDYGALRGMGQWRNAGYGRFRWEEIS